MDVAIDGELDRLRRELDRLRVENVRLSRLLTLRGQDTASAPEQLSAVVSPPGWSSCRRQWRTTRPVHRPVPGPDRRIRVRWATTRSGASGWMPAVAGNWRKGTDREAASYLPLTAEVVSAHLVGGVFIGLYPLLTDNSCHFLVADFDGALASIHGNPLPGRLTSSRGIYTRP